MMIPFILTIALGFVSFLASAFVILRIVIPILPPHPLSRRVAPSEFGLPDYNFRSLSSADKSHLWLASLDLLALFAFIWQAVTEYSGGPTGLADAGDAAASARLWFALTVRQTCLFVVSGLTFIHIRMGRSVSFGRIHWMVWAPTLLLIFSSTTLAAVFAGVGVSSFFAGIVAYSATTAVLSTAAFGGLVYTLIIIKRNLASLNEPTDSWPPVKEEKPRPSFATEDVDALREGSSWLTSDAASSRHESMSNWSFSTHHTRQSSMRVNPPPSQPSQHKSSYWFNPPTSGTDSSVPPVPPLPSAYRGHIFPGSAVGEDPDPFRRDVPGRPRLGSQSSWLTSPSVSQATMSAWSYSATPCHGSAIDVNAALISSALPSRPGTPLIGSALDVNAGLLPQVLASRPNTPMASVVDLSAGLLPQSVPSRPATPALSSANVLGGYGYTADSEKGITSLAVTGTEVDVSYSRYVFWLLSIWVPFFLSLPYLVSVASPGSASIEALPIMLVLSITSSAPLLAMNILVRSPIPIPTGLFGVHAEPSSVVMRAPSPAETLAVYCREYKKSGSITVVEGRRSGDVWISQGDAVDGKGKLGRALGLITPLPRLVVLPPEEQQQDGEITPPLPMQEDTTISPTPQSTNSAELGRLRKESKSSSHFSGDETFATRIMIAQRHYSAVATTVVVPASPERTESPDGLLSVATGVDMVPPVTPTSSSHLRSRSVSSIIAHHVSTPDISRPPSQPLPPTPPNIRSAKQTAEQLIHRKSRSSEFSFGTAVNNDIREIDALTAGVLPLLVPGLQLGDEVKIRDWEEFSPPLSSTVTKARSPRVGQGSSGLEFGVLGQDDFASPQFHSTPAQEKQSHKGGKVSGHKRKHLSLPSLGLSKDAVHAWKNDLDRELATKTVQQHRHENQTSDSNQRSTIWGDEAVPNFIAHPVTESQHVPADGEPLGRQKPTRNMGLRVEVPQATNSARTLLATLIPPSAASTATLFEVESTFEPIAQSTPQDTLKSNPYSRKYQAIAMAQTTGSRCSSVAYVESDEKSLEPVLSADCDNHSKTPAPPAVRPPSRKISMSLRKSSTPGSESRSTVQSGGLRPLTLLKDRDSNKEGDASKFAGTRPLILGKKKQKLQVTRDENDDPNAGKKHLKPLPLRRSDSSKMRGILRRDEVLPTVIVRPPSTNAKTGSLYEHR